MQEIFYDYKHNAYAVLDAIGQNDWQVYLLQSADGKYYIFDTKNAELKNSAKSLRSVFNRYKSNVMYDIPKHAQLIEGDKLLDYETLKYDVLAYDVQKRQGVETSVRIAQAKANGWQELNIETAEIALKNDNLNIIIDDKQFIIKPRTTELDFGTMREDELKEYVTEWINTYNNSVGDLSSAQTNAEGRILSARQVAQWAATGKANSDFLTEKLVENLDISNKYDGYQGDRAFSMAQSIVRYMSENNIPFFSDAKLMGDCNGLEYNIYDVTRRHHVYSAEYRASEILSDLEIKALHLLDEKSVLPLNAAIPTEKSYTEIIDIPNNDDIDFKAKKYHNSSIGTEVYDIVVGSKYPFFDAGKRIIGSCNQHMLNTILGSKSEPSKKLNSKLDTNSKSDKTTKVTGKQNQMQM